MEYKEKLFIEDNRLNEGCRFELLNIIKSNFEEDGFRIHSRKTALAWVCLQDDTVPFFVKNLEQKVLEDILKIPLVRKEQGAYKGDEGKYNLNHVRGENCKLSLQMDTMFVDRLVDSLSVYDNVCILHFDNKLGLLSYQLVDKDVLSNTFDRYFAELQAELEEYVKQYKIQQVMDEFKNLTTSEQTEFLKTVITNMRNSNVK